MQPGSARFAVPAAPAEASEGGEGAGTNRLHFTFRSCVLSGRGVSLRVGCSVRLSQVHAGFGRWLNASMTTLTERVS